MKLSSNTSLQEILRRRQGESFVGRDLQREQFLENLVLPIDDLRRRFLFNIYGQGGVGKTTLLRRLRDIVQERGWLTAWTDESEEDVPQVMGRLAEHLQFDSEVGKDFVEYLKRYRQLRQELELDPEAPRGLSAFLGKTLAKAGIALGRRIPIGGFIFDLINEEDLSSQVADLTVYLSKKINNKDELKLLQNPLDELTPRLLKGIRQRSSENCIALFFDTYEITREFVDSWLRRLIEGAYGEVPANILFVIGGRYELDPNLWMPLNDLIVHMPIEPFTKEEVKQYLGRKGIVEEKISNAILKLSGGLPLLVATLAAENPKDASAFDDPSDTAVERFLKWISDPRKRQLVIDASIPRKINNDVLEVLESDGAGKEAFSWLKSMPFVSDRLEGLVFHDVVRTQLLRFKRRESPNDFIKINVLLAKYYTDLATVNGRSEEPLGDGKFQEYSLEALYHRLCSSPQGEFSNALEGFLNIYIKDRYFAISWAETIARAGSDADMPEILIWGERILSGITENDDMNRKVETFSSLAEFSGISPKSRAIALLSRALAEIWLGNLVAAECDITAALELVPEYPEAIARDGMLKFFMGDIEAANREFDRALDLDPYLISALNGKVLVDFVGGRFYDVFYRLKKIVDIDSSYSSAAASVQAMLLFWREILGVLPAQIIEAAIPKFWMEELSRLPRYAEIIKDEDRDDIDEWLKSASKISEALRTRLADTIALQLAASRTELSMDNGEFDEYKNAILEKMGRFNNLIEMNPGSLGLLMGISDGSEKLIEQVKIRGLIETGQFLEAIEMLDEIIEANCTSGDLNQRGLLLSYMNRHEEALEDYRRALMSNPGDPILQYNLAVVAVAGKKDIASEAVNTAREVLSKLAEEANSSPVYFYGMGGLEALEGHYELALELLEKAVGVSRIAAGWARNDVAWLEMRKMERFKILTEIESAGPI